MEYLQSIGRKGSKAGEFDRPRSLAITTQGNIVVADTGNQRVQVGIIPGFVHGASLSPDNDVHFIKYCMLLAVTCIVQMMSIRYI